MREGTSGLSLSHRHEASTAVPCLPSRGSEFPFIDAPPTPLFRQSTTRHRSRRHALDRLIPGRARTSDQRRRHRCPRPTGPPGSPRLRSGVGREIQVQNPRSTPADDPRLRPASVPFNRSLGHPKTGPRRTLQTARERSNGPVCSGATPFWDGPGCSLSSPPQPAASPSAPMSSSSGKNLTSIRTVD